MKTQIDVKEYKTWYSIWRQDSNQHMGRHFCEHFQIDDEEMKTSEDWMYVFGKIGTYFTCGCD